MDCSVLLSLSQLIQLITERGQVKGEFVQSQVSSLNCQDLKTQMWGSSSKNSNEEDQENFRLVDCISVSGKYMEQIPLKIFYSRHMKVKKVIGNSQRGFTDHKLWSDLASLTMSSMMKCLALQTGREEQMSLTWASARLLTISSTASLYPAWGQMD